MPEDDDFDDVTIPIPEKIMLRVAERARLEADEHERAFHDDRPTDVGTEFDLPPEAFVT